MAAHAGFGRSGAVMRRIARAVVAAFILAALPRLSLPAMAESTAPIDPEQVQ